MRLPPLPSPAPSVTEEWLRARTVGDPPRLAGPIGIVAYDPAWPALYAGHAARIRAALGPVALAVEHVGSTAVPGLAAKFRIDIDVIVTDPRAEESYLPALEAAGHVLRVREPDWYEHRCLHGFDPMTNVHVFPPDCDEHLRHLIRSRVRGREALALSRRGRRRRPSA